MPTPEPGPRSRLSRSSVVSRRRGRRGDGWPGVAGEVMPAARLEDRRQHSRFVGMAQRSRRGSSGEAQVSGRVIMEPIGELSDAAKAEIARLAEQAERARASVGGTGDATAYVRAVLGSIPENFRSLIAEDWLEHWPHRAELAAVEEPVIEAETARLLARLDAEIPEAHKAMDVLLSRLRTTRIPAA